MRKISNTEWKQRFLFPAFLLSLIAMPMFALAAARTSPFTVGETIDPGTATQPCGPADANCFPSLNVLPPVGTSTGQTGYMAYQELLVNGTNTVALRAPDSISTSTVWTLPAADGLNNQVLTTNGAGGLAWTTAIAGGAAAGGNGAIQFANGVAFTGDNTQLTFVGGNLGIGTSTPYAKLSVVGDIVASRIVATSTTATSSFAGGVQAGSLAVTGSGTSSFANGLNLSTGCFAVNGTCLTTSTGASTTLLADNNTFSGSDQFAKLIVTNSTTTAATSTNFFSSILSATTGTITNLIASVANITNLISTNSTSTNATTTNQYAASLIAGSATTTNLNSTNLMSTNAVFTGATTSGLAVTGVSTSSFANGIALTNGCFAQGGVCLTQGLLAAVTSIGPGGQLQSGPAVTFATTTSAYQGLTASTTISGVANTITFTNSLSGILLAGGGGTGIAVPSAAGILLGSYAGGAYQQLATSSLGLLTTNVAEGSNLYFTAARDLAALTGQNVQASFFIATSTTNDSSLQGLTFTRATGTSATTTNFNTINLSSTNAILTGATTTALNVSGNSTTTFGAGTNISSGCYAINGVCLSTGGGGGASTTLLSDNNTFTGIDQFAKLTVTNSTTTAATTTSFFSSMLSATTGTITNLVASIASFTGLTTTNSTSTNATTTNQYAASLIAGSATTTNLNVSTLLTLTGATTTSANGINLQSGCFSVAGTCLSSGGGGSAVGGTGAVQFANGTAFNGDNARFAYVGGNLGIGTSSPYARLAVSGTPTSTGPELVTNGSFTGSAAGWTLSGCSAYGSNQVTVTYDGICSFPILSTNIVTTAGKTYLISFTLSSVADDTVTVYLDNNTNPFFSGDFGRGKHSVLVTTDFSGTDVLTFGSTFSHNPSTWTIDDVSAREVGGTSVALAVAGIDGQTLMSIGDISENLAVGYDTLKNNYSGYRNIAIGSSALTDNTTGYKNIAIGLNTLNLNTIGSSNVAISENALESNIDGFANVAVGVNALLSNTSGIQNNAVGQGALSSNTIGGSNNAVGDNALGANTTGNGNNAIGSFALSLSTTGFGNNAFGAYALSFLTTGIGNSALGQNAGFNLGNWGTSSNNVFIGRMSAFNQMSGDNNIAIGYNVKLASTTGSNQLSIGNLIYASGLSIGDDGVTDTQPAGNIGIGTGTPWAKLTIQNRFGSTTTLFDVASTTNQSGSVTSSLFNVQAGGSVGIGTSTPSHNYGLSIASTLYVASTTASSTFGNGINLTKGCYAVNGVCLTTGGGGGASTTLLADNNTFSGTDQFAKLIITNSTTTNATTTFLNVSGSLTLTGGTTSASNGINLTSGCFSVSGTCITGGGGGGSAVGGTGAIQFANGTAFNGDNTQLTYVGGNLGIGTTTPYAKLSVNGTVSPTGPELITNGTFDTDASAWMLGDCAAWGAGAMTVNYSSCTTPRVSTTFSTVAGHTYLLTFNLSNISKDSVYYYFSNNSQAIDYGPYTNGTTTVAFTTDYTGTETITFDPWNYPGGDMWTIDNVSIKEAPAVTPAIAALGYNGDKALSIADALGNVFVGLSAGQSNSSGTSNAGYGNRSLASNTSGSDNTANGYSALYANTTGYNNAANGYTALLANTTGNYDTANGAQSLANNTIGSNNTANGEESLYSNTIGNYNTANGALSLKNNITGSNNTANGEESLYSNTTGDYNSANGYHALNDNTSGAYNTAEGVSALAGNATGTYNTAIGALSGGGNIGGNNNIFIGDNTGGANELTNATALGSHAQVGASNSLVLGGTGAWAVNVGIGTASPFAELTVQGNYGSTSPLFDISTSTNSSGSATSSLFTILASGNVGIGTSSPYAKLAVNNPITPTGPELITNGTFTGSAAGWTLGNCAAYNSNHVTVTHTACNDRSVSTTFSSISGTTYLLFFSITGEVGETPSFSFYNNGKPYDYNNGWTNGDHTIAFTTDYTGSETIVFDSLNSVPGGTWTIDNVSIKESPAVTPALQLIGYDGTPWLTLGDDILGNTSLGRALNQTTTGVENTAIGSYAGSSNTTGNYNFFGGFNAGAANTGGSRNVFLGKYSGFSNTNGAYNVFTGSDSGYANTTGAYNTFTGYQAGYSNTTGYENTFIGNQAGNSNTSGYLNTFIGDQVGNLNTTGFSNTFVGEHTGVGNTNGYFNTFIGESAGLNNTSGNSNTFIGFHAGLNNATGTNNIFTGLNAGNLNAGGSYNIFSGSVAGYSNATGSYNIFTGTYAGYSNITGGDNIFTGTYAGYFSTSGIDNIFTGPSSGYSNTTGSFNNFIGYKSGYNVTTGAYNVAIGQNVDLASSTGSQQLNIGNLLYGTGLYNGGSVSSDPVTGGMIGIGTSSPSATLALVGNIFASTTATSTFQGNGINLTSGCFAVNGTCVGAGGVGGSSAVGGTGAIQFANGTSFNGDNTQLTWDNTNKYLGVGTSTPYKALSVVGEVAIDTNGGPGYIWWNGSPFITTDAGTNSTFVGLNSGLSSSGARNTSLGVESLFTNTTGNDNTAIGHHVLYSNTTGWHNLGVGNDTLYSNLNGVYNVGLGEGALYSNISGSVNVAIGVDAMSANQTGTDNIAIGDQPLLNNETGLSNIAIGTLALLRATSSSYNVAIGETALSTFTEGTRNTAVGSYAADGLEVGTGNTAIGYEALNGFGNFDENTAIGDRALTRNTSGASSTALGAYAGFTNLTGNNNLFLGDEADALTSALSNAAAIGSHAKVGESNALVLGGTGMWGANVGIGTTSPYAKLSVDNTASTSGVELTTNGDFNLGDASNWTLGDCAAYGSNDIVVTYTACSSANVSTTFPTVDGKSYIISFTLSNVSGDTINVGFNNNSAYKGNYVNGTYTFVINSNYTGTETIYFDEFYYIQDSSYTINNLSIQEVSPITPTLVAIGYDGNSWLNIGGDTKQSTALGDGAPVTSSNTDGNNTMLGYYAGHANAGGSYNTFVGSLAGSNNNNGSYNVFTGVNAGANNTSGSNNVFSGFLSGNNNTSGYGNTFTGGDSGFSNTTGHDNTFTGQNAGFANTTGYQNVFNGHAAGNSNTTGYGNVFMGDTAGEANNTGSVNVFTGYLTGYFNTSGSDNIFSGGGAGYYNTTGSSNIFLGTGVAQWNQSATNTIAIGYGAAGGNTYYSNQGGVYLGYQSGYDASTDSDYNTMLGYQSGHAVTTGANNILIGANAGYDTTYLTTGSNNIVIGNNIGATSSDMTRGLDIGNLLYGTNLDGYGTTLSTGNIGIGTSSPYAKLSVEGNVAFNGLSVLGATGDALCMTSGGEVEQNVGATSCLVSSRRFKENITYTNATSSLATVMLLRPAAYNYNWSPEPRLGLIAEDVDQVDSRLVARNASGTPQSVRYEELTSVLAGAIQEVNTHVGMLEGFTIATSTTDASGTPTLLGSLIDRLKAWLSDATNGIQTIIANVFIAKEVHSEKLCVGDTGNETCVTKSQLDQLLQNAAVGASGGAVPQVTYPTPQAPTPPPAPPATSTPAATPISDAVAADSASTTPTVPAPTDTTPPPMVTPPDSTPAPTPAPLPTDASTTPAL